jgi:hypothetical protein
VLKIERDKERKIVENYRRCQSPSGTIELLMLKTETARI